MELEENPFRKKFLIYARCVKLWGRMRRQEDSEAGGHAGTADSQLADARPDVGEFEAEYVDLDVDKILSKEPADDICRTAIPARH